MELIITIGGTLGVVMASNGIDGSMSVIVWLLVWRFVVGIGIGAEQVHLSSLIPFHQYDRSNASTCFFVDYY